MAIFAPRSPTSWAITEPVNLSTLDSLALGPAVVAGPGRLAGEQGQGGAARVLGVDDTGRDQFVRIAYGARVSLQVAFTATGISLVTVLFGASQRLLPGQDRHRDLARDRRRPRAADPPPRTGSRPRAVPTRRCFWGSSNPGRTRDLDHRSLRLAVHRPDRARPDPSLREKEFIEASRSRGREPPNHPAGAAAQRGSADHRLHDADHPEQHPVRGGVVVPGRGRARHDAVVGGMLADAGTAFTFAPWLMIFRGSPCSSRPSPSTWSGTACVTPSILGRSFERIEGEPCERTTSLGVRRFLTYGTEALRRGCFEASTQSDRCGDGPRLRRRGGGDDDGGEPGRHRRRPEPAARSAGCAGRRHRGVRSARRRLLRHAGSTTAAVCFRNLMSYQAFRRTRAGRHLPGPRRR